MAGLAPFRRQEGAALGKLARARGSQAGRPIAEIEHAPGAVGGGGENLPADLRFGGVEAVVEGHAVEVVPKRDAGGQGMAAETFEVGAILVAGIAFGAHERVMIHREHLGLHFPDEPGHMLFIGGGAQRAGRGIVGEQVDVAEAAGAPGADFLRPPGQFGKGARAGFVPQQVAPARRAVRQFFGGAVGRDQRFQPKPFAALEVGRGVGAGLAYDQCEVGFGDLPVARIQVLLGGRRHPQAHHEAVLHETDRARRRRARRAQQQQRGEHGPASPGGRRHGRKRKLVNCHGSLWSPCAMGFSSKYTRWRRRGVQSEGSETSRPR